MYVVTERQHLLLTDHLPPLLALLLHFRHGTHVSGIIGAKANGKWGVGVVPGMPIYAFKALDQFGSGMKSDVFRAFDAILTLLQQGAKIAAVNLSLVLNANSQVPPAEADTESICGYVKQMAAYGTAVVAAAGMSKVWQFEQVHSYGVI